MKGKSPANVYVCMMLNLSSILDRTESQRELGLLFNLNNNQLNETSRILLHLSEMSRLIFRDPDQVLRFKTQSDFKLSPNFFLFSSRDVSKS